MGDVISAPAYERVLARLSTYAHDDWLGVEVLVRSLRECFDRRPSFAEVRPVAIRAVGDLISAGARAGDLTEDGFSPWPVGPQEMTDRLARSLEERDDWPLPDELGWIAFPDEPAR